MIVHNINKHENFMLFKKFFKLIISSTLLFLVNQSFKPAYAADCGGDHLSRPGADKAKALAKQRKSLKNLEKVKELKTK